MPPDDVAPAPGDSAAFRRLFDACFGELYRFAYRYVRSPEVAKDLVHEAFLRLWRQRSQVDLAGAGARSYVYTIVRYQALDHLRRRRVEERWRQEYAAPIMAEQGAVLSPSGPEEDLAAREIRGTIDRALGTLPPRQQQVVRLRWQHQASYDEIAETLGISPKTAAVHFGRAIQRLRELLADFR
jgi:RNA polymerase sigma-70 factor (ECF subfamily)